MRQEKTELNPKTVDLSACSKWKEPSNNSMLACKLLAEHVQWSARRRTQSARHGVRPFTKSITFIVERKRLRVVKSKRHTLKRATIGLNSKLVEQVWPRTSLYHRCSIGPVKGAVAKKRSVQSTSTLDFPNFFRVPLSSRNVWHASFRFVLNLPPHRGRTARLWMDRQEKSASRDLH